MPEPAPPPGGSREVDLQAGAPWRRPGLHRNANEGGVSHSERDLVVGALCRTSTDPVRAHLPAHDLRVARSRLPENALARPGAQHPQSVLPPVLRRARPETSSPGVLASGHWCLTPGSPLVPLAGFAASPSATRPRDASSTRAVAAAE